MLPLAFSFGVTATHQLPTHTLHSRGYNLGHQETAAFITAFTALWLAARLLGPSCGALSRGVPRYFDEAGGPQGLKPAASGPQPRQSTRSASRWAARPSTCAAPHRPTAPAVNIPSLCKSLCKEMRGQRLCTRCAKALPEDHPVPSLDQHRQRVRRRPREHE